jgi:hypothetical protein
MALNQVQPSPLVGVQAVSASVQTSNSFVDALVANTLSKPAEVVSTNSTSNRLTHWFAVRPAPAQSGGIISVAIGTLPASESVTIKYRVLVNGPSLPHGQLRSQPDRVDR